MLQRLVRQIRENLQTKDITVATNTAQRDNIINQLGNAINIVTETERRGTFPAIALASSFLAKEKGCGRDEVVVVMPATTTRKTATSPPSRGWRKRWKRTRPTSSSWG